jgi:hypothetical protein
MAEENKSGPPRFVAFDVGKPPRRVFVPLTTTIASGILLTGLLPKAKSVTIALPDVDGAAFEHYIRFLSFGKPLGLSATNGPSGHPLEKQFTWKECQKYISYYLFGAEVRDTEYQSFLLKELERWLQPSQPPDYEVLKCVMQAPAADHDLKVFILSRMFSTAKEAQEALRALNECWETNDSSSTDREEVRQRYKPLLSAALGDSCWERISNNSNRDSKISVEQHRTASTLTSDMLKRSRSESGTRQMLL